MNAGGDASRGSWLFRNRMTVISLVAVIAYAAFVQWIWGWPVLFREWAKIGLVPVLSALALLVATYFIRCYRIYDYFPGETRGRFLLLLRVTQVHNLLNIMLPFRAGETSFPILMRSEFSVPLARSTSALLLMRLLDLHALFAAAGIGLVVEYDNKALGWLLWGLFLVSPLALFFLKGSFLALVERRLPEKLGRLLEEIEAGLPANALVFVRAWLMTVLNWSTKVAVLAWVLFTMGVLPLGACFGGALGGELSSVLPVHAPAGVGTYPAGITAGAISFGASAGGAAFDLLASASVNAHLLIIVSAVAGTLLSIVLSPRS
ncbi:flippase-like domain-containing protein [Pararhizobium sp. BT-229]|uniref:flippase-like domain-containing protein n=1 Tax=Pararhizobium sp. BT-229 TaxID=2986923 RepID=UPI0021F6E941|nr:flippase-like domain-containing protein [Pararhizobium sp. BT-229]MCV9963501.1 flippase-like domain-containing protein [Pararhizobium sp. BT-229]